MAKYEEKIVCDYTPEDMDAVLGILCKKLDSKTSVEDLLLDQDIDPDSPAIDKLVQLCEKAGFRFKLQIEY